MFVCKYTEVCGDSCMHIYREHDHFMKVNWYINNSGRISFSSRRQPLTLQWRERGRGEKGRDAGGVQQMGTASQKFTSFSQI